MTPEIRTIDPIQLVGMSIEMSISNNNTGELWQRFMPRRMEIQHLVKEEFYSLQRYEGGLDVENFDNEVVFEQWAAMQVSTLEALPEGMESMQIEGGQYAVFVHKGLAGTFGKTSGYIFGEWLPNSGYALDERAHFQLMGEKYYGPNDPDSEEEVWIPIVPILDPQMN